MIRAPSPLALRGFPILLAFALLPAAAVGQERARSEFIRSDRPGLGDGAWVLPSGVWQAELGGTLRDAGVDEYLTGEGLLRLGLPAVELRLFLPTLAVARSGEDEVALDDVGVGAKLPLTAGGRWEWALGAAVTLPTSTAATAPDDATGSAALLGDIVLAPNTLLTLNVGYGQAFAEGADGTVSVLVTPAMDLGGGTGLYGGYAGYFAEGADAHILEGGLTKLTDEDTQWDLNAGYDVENETWFLGLGVARRWR